MRLFTSLVVLFSISLLTSCAKENPSFSLLPEQDNFNQTASIANNKVDIIFVVDDSGTMANHQTNLANNFENFMSDFISKNFDYQIVVASTDSWVREINYNLNGCEFSPNPNGDPAIRYTSSADCRPTLASFGAMTHFRDGEIYGDTSAIAGLRSGIYMITSLMDPAQVLSSFAINIRTGTRGDGTRESGFASIRSVLRRNEDGSVGYNGETHTALSEFRRPDAFLALIMFSDEEDQSRKMDGTHYSTTEEYVDSFIAFMDGYTGGIEGRRPYNISSIVLEDINNCTYGLHPQATQGDRYVAVAQATNGVVGTICSDNFSDQLDAISKSIVTLSTRFQLSREPVPSSIDVIVAGLHIPNDAINGWVYVRESNTHYVEFHGNAIPAQGATITINFEPVTIL